MLLSAQCSVLRLVGGRGRKWLKVVNNTTNTVLYQTPSIMAPASTNTNTSTTFTGVKAVFFDFMGTCLDWHSSIVDAFPDRIPYASRTALALAWRRAFFEDIHDRFDRGLEPEDIDETHARLLARLVTDDQSCSPTTRLDDATFSHTVRLSEPEQHDAVRAWHHMAPWPDIPQALCRLRSKYEVFVLANGTTRLQLDLTRSSGLEFDMLFSSQLLGLTKPDPRFYETALRLVAVKPEEAVMVASHAYDLRAAAKVGLHTVYIQRTTEDQNEEMDRIRHGVDGFVDGRDGTATGGGLGEVAELLGV